MKKWNIHRNAFSFYSARSLSKQRDISSSYIIFRQFAERYMRTYLENYREKNAVRQ